MTPFNPPIHFFFKTQTISVTFWSPLANVKLLNRHLTVQTSPGGSLNQLFSVYFYTDQLIGYTFGTYTTFLLGLPFSIKQSAKWSICLIYIISLQPNSLSFLVKWVPDMVPKHGFYEVLGPNIIIVKLEIYIYLSPCILPFQAKLKARGLFTWPKGPVRREC